jgi:hypothetical protein
LTWVATNVFYPTPVSIYKWSAKNGALALGGSVPSCHSLGQHLGLQLEVEVVQRSSNIVLVANVSVGISSHLLQCLLKSHWQHALEYMSITTPVATELQNMLPS